MTMRRTDVQVQDALPEGAYAARAVLDAGTLDMIREANASYLGLVAERHARAPGAPVLGLPGGIVARVAALDAAARSRAARCRYTLFNMRFEDAPFWQCLVRDGPRAMPGGNPDDAAFVRTAVFFAWHLVQRGDLAAALALGMTPAVELAWRALPLSTLERAAMAALPQLGARWGGHPRFWPRLLEAAARNRDDLAEHVRLLGLQLLAADGYRAQLANQPLRERSTQNQA
jgi:hypothetical protein